MDPASDPIEAQKQKLMQKAGAAMAKKALGDAVDALTLTPEERAKREKEAEAQKRKRLVMVVLGGLALVVGVVVVMRLMAALWLYAIGFAVVAGIGGAGYLLLKPKIAAIGADRRLRAAEKEAENQKLAEAKAIEDKKSQAAQKLDDDLARLKQQL